MPIIDVEFEDGLLTAREVGEVTAEDAHMWARTIAQYIEEHRGPIVALIDARDTTYIEQEARKLFVRASNLPNFVATAVVTADMTVMQTARVLGMLAPDNHTHVFADMEEAEIFARSTLDNLAAV